MPDGRYQDGLGKRSRNTRARMTSAVPFVVTRKKTPEQARASHKRALALNHYARTGDPRPAIRLGLLPVGAKRKVTRTMKALRDR